MEQIQTIKLGQVSIGDGRPCVVIAEGCDNHLKSLSRAKEMAHAAKEAGADIIKWQLHLPEEEMVKDAAIAASKEMLSKWGSIWDFVVNFALPVDAHRELKEYCDKIGIQYLCTPFSLRAAEILNEWNVDGFKIGSGETDDLPMLEEVAKFGKPMIVSTGMSELGEIDAMVNAIKLFGAPLMLAHCMSVYGGHRSDRLQLGLISVLRERYGVPVGLSDHTSPEGVTDPDGLHISQEEQVFATIAQGACFIEKHFTLDRNQADADSRFSLDPTALKKLVTTIRLAEKALGKERKVYPEEVGVAEWAKRSLVATRDIPDGTPITRDLLTSKRPGTGIRSRLYRDVLGKVAKRTIQANEILEWHDFV